MDLKPMGADQGRGLEQVTAREVAVDCGGSGVKRRASLHFSLPQDTLSETLDGEPLLQFSLQEVALPLWYFAPSAFPWRGGNAPTVFQLPLQPAIPSKSFHLPCSIQIKAKEPLIWTCCALTAVPPP